MKKTLVALAALAATGAFAQSSLSMYGTLDLGMYTQNKGLNSNPDAASSILGLPATGSNQLGRVSGMASSNTTPSKWGIKGVEDMGGGNTTFFQLESALNINYGTNPNGRLNDSLYGTSSGAASAGPANASVFTNGEGSVQGQMFDREASLGMSGSWGTLKGGRMTTVMADTIGPYDPLRVGYAVSPLGFNGGYSGAGYTGESRWDNSLKYIYNTGANTVALGYKTAGTTNGLAQGAGFGATYEYAPSNWGVKVGYEKNNDAILATNGTGACVAGTYKTCNPGVAVGVPALALTFADTNALTIVGKYTANALTFKGGFERITTAAPAHAAYDNATYYPTLNSLPVSAVSVFNGPSRIQTMAFGGVNYQLNDRVELSAAYYRLSTNAYGANAGFAGANDSSSRANYLGFEGTYSLSKRTRLYGTAATNSLSGPVWTAGATQAFPTVTTFSTGVVHSF